MRSLPPTNVINAPTKIPVFWFSLHEFVDELTQARLALEEVRATHPQSTPSNVKAIYMSPWKSHLLNEKFHPLCELTESIGKQISSEHLKANLDALNLTLKLTDCWGVIYDNSDHTIPHMHYPADLSAIVYLEADENSAPIRFGDELELRPKPGLMVIFPGILMHEVPANYSKRVVIAMNLQKFPKYMVGA
jgi:hypothetical protein